MRLIESNVTVIINNGHALKKLHYLQQQINVIPGVNSASDRLNHCRSKNKIQAWKVSTTHFIATTRTDMYALYYVHKKQF